MKENQNRLKQEIFYEEDEIDLYELFLVLKKRWKIILSSTLIFLVLGILYLYVAKPVYKTDFVISVPIVNSNENIDLTDIGTTLIKKLNDIKKDDFKAFAKSINVSQQEAKKIAKIDILEDKISRRKNNTLIKVSLEVFDPKIINKVSNNIVIYLNNRPFIQNYIKKRYKELSDYLIVLQKKLKDTEILRNNLLKNIEQNNVNVLGFNPIEIEEKVISLQKEILATKEQLQNLKGYKLAVEPYIPEKPYKPKKMLIIIISVISGLFLGIFGAFFIEYIQKAKNRYKHKGESI